LGLGWQFPGTEKLVGLTESLGGFGLGVGLGVGVGVGLMTGCGVGVGLGVGVGVGKAVTTSVTPTGIFSLPAAIASVAE